MYSVFGCRRSSWLATMRLTLSFHFITLETKILKQRLRDHLDPSKDLGHSDKHGKGSTKAQPERSEHIKPHNLDQTDKDAAEKAVQSSVQQNPDESICETCG